MTRSVPQKSNAPSLSQAIGSIVTFSVAMLFGIAGLGIFFTGTQLDSRSLSDNAVHGAMLIGIGIIIMQNLHRSFNKFD